jgi:GxxExxY protein
VELDEITEAVIEASIAIHRKLGGGLLESVYTLLLAAALERRGLRVQREFPVSFTYDGMFFENGFRADLIVESCVVIETKSMEKLAHVHTKQLLTYLRLLNLRVGLLLNFGAATMREGVKRVVNDLDPDTSPVLRVNR